MKKLGTASARLARARERLVGARREEAIKQLARHQEPLDAAWRLGLLGEGGNNSDNVVGWQAFSFLFIGRSYIGFEVRNFLCSLFSFLFFLGRLDLAGLFL
ncbi:MAG: hypothetical protein DRP01_09840 [Archaeoglobales archaeon]|nr:MAG: hypothetical protein DRP01_09840 [Archaeoglobales archaeon]